MIKKISYLASAASFLLIMTACNEEPPTPEEAFNQFSKHLSNQEYEQMYELLSNEAKESITQELFVERYSRIYEGIQVGEVELHLTADDEADPEQLEEEAALPFEQVIHTFLGPLTNQGLMTLKLEEWEEESVWTIDWEPTMIVPQLKAEDSVRVQALQPERGEIVDRNGQGLAINGSALSIGFIPENMEGEENETIEALTELLPFNEDELTAILNQDWVQPNMFVPITSVPKSENELVRTATELPGVAYQEAAAREYPLAEAAAHLTGYIGTITAEELEELDSNDYNEHSVIGKSGLERIFEDRLKGEPGGVIYIEGEDGQRKDVLLQKEAVDGETITLTIDAELQQSIYSEMADDAGTAVAMHPLNGDVLTLANAPAYNPNEFVLGITQASWEQLNEDEAKPLLNRFTQRYAPGSSIKPITAAIALENGWDPAEELVIEGSSWQKDSSWGNYRVNRVSSKLERLNLTDAMIYSDNIYFAKMALEMGAGVLEEGFRNLGFEESLPFPYGMPASTFAEESLDSDILLADTGYGQGDLLITPLHLALLYTPFVNEGSIVAPNLIQDESQENGFWKESVISTENAAGLLTTIERVVEDPNGTASDVKLDGVPLAGKTGTTEYKLSQGEDGKENGWFVALNTDEPELLVLMMIEDVEGRGGSHYVTEKVKKVLETHFQ